MLSASFALLRPFSAISLLAIVCTLILGALPAAAFARGTPDGFADLTAKLAPAVVNVSTTQVLKRDQAGPDDGPQGSSPFDQFFQDFFDKAPGGRPRRIQSLGSGFIIDPSGIIVTNEHVIEGADEIQVNLGSGEDGTGGTSFKAKVIGKDDLTDIALLKVNAPKPLPYVKFGDSDKARVGDWVVAVGDPFGLGGTVTAGIISAFNRDIQAGPYDDFIQTDAAINRGNSGGPLFNMQGQVIGINTAIISPTGGSIGIGFAIPSSIAANVIEQLRKYGHARRGWIGVRIQTVSPDIAEGLGLSQPEGALVAEVTPGGPAAKAGMKPGDLILKFNGKTVGTMRALPRLVAQTRIGGDVPVEILRAGKTKNVTVHVGRLKEQQVSAVGDAPSASPQQPHKPAANMVMGLQLSKLTPQLRRHYQIDDDVDGVVVTGIDGTSPAVGHVMEGDVITQIGSTKVTTPDQIRQEVGAAKQTDKKVLLMMVNHAGQMGYRGIRVDGK